MNTDEQFASFEICRVCYELRGPFKYTWKGEHYRAVQKCQCERDDREPGEEPDTWFTYDFNTGAELCKCCGATVLRSGSRWSTWFCKPCRERVTEFNDRAAIVVVPIGRHSLMHRIGLRTTPRPSRDEISAFVEGLGNLVDRTNRVDAWAHQVVRRNIDTAQVDAERIALRDYLEAVADVDPAQRFAEMIAWLCEAAGRASEERCF